MNDDIVSRHGTCQGLEVLGVASNDSEALVSLVMHEVPVAARREVVVDGNQLGLGLGQQAVDEMAADEARPADEEVPATVAQRSDSQ
jgi:hypothetical protein